MGLRGSRSGVLNVRRSDIREVRLYLLVCYWRKVINFHASVEIERIGHSLIHHSVTMEVAMHIAPVALGNKTITMEGNVAEYHPIAIMTPTNVIEILRIVRHLEDVMIAANENLSSIETLQHAQPTARDGHVSQVVNSVARIDGFVPPLHHCLVHLLHRRKRAHGRTVSMHESKHFGVTPVGVRGDEEAHESAVEMGTAGNRTQYSMLFAWRVPTPQTQRLLCLGVISGDHIVGANNMVSV